MTGLSKGAAQLLGVLNELFPREEVITEYHIGERLFLDMYIPAYSLGAEYHGRQHFEFVEHYHGDIDGFEQSQKRDQRKIDLCQQRGIALAVFTYEDEIGSEIVYTRVLQALQQAPLIEDDDKELTWKEKAARYRRERTRAAYRRAKEQRDG